MSSQPAFYWSKIAPLAVYSASDTLDGTSVDDIRYATEGTGWGPANITGTKSIVIDNLTALTADSLCILGGNLDGVTIGIRGSTDNFVTSNVVIHLGVPVESDINTAFINFSSNSYRYWKINFSTFPSNMRVNHLVLDVQTLLPFFEIDPDEDGIEPTATHLISKGGLYLGTAQDKAETKMPLQFGEINPADLPALQAWADANIREVNPFFLQVDSSVARIHFGRLTKGGRWGSPLETGVNVVRNNTFETRAI